MESSADAAAVDDGDSGGKDTPDAEATVDDGASDGASDPEASGGDTVSDGDASDDDVDASGGDDASQGDGEESGAGIEEPTEAAAGPAPRWWRRIRPTGMARGTVLRWVAVAVLVLVLAGAGFEGWVLYRHHQRDVAAAQALEAAKNFALALTTVDPNALDKNFADVLDGATGDFKDMYTQVSEQLRQDMIQNKAVAHGTVIDAAVKSVNKANDKVEVVLFIDQSVSNASSQGPQLDRSRLVMTMEKVNGRWLASKLDLP